MTGAIGAESPTYRPRAAAWTTTMAASALVFASYLFRLPPLLNARSTNSDAAIVGLQAMHVLRGELSAFLWGSGYQTAADAFVAAAFFAVFGATPTALMMSALTLHVVATALVFATLCRRVGPWTSLLLTMPLVVSPSSVHTYALYPPRQLAITLAVASLWAIDGAVAPKTRAPTRWLVAGGALFGLAVSADPYPMVLAPVVMALALFVSFERPLQRLAVLGGAMLAGLVPFVLLHRAAGAKQGPMGMTTTVLRHNWDLLLRECLPWALSYKVYFAHNVMDYRPWDAPPIVHAVQIVGALAAGVIVTIGLVALALRAVPWPMRGLGFIGALTYPVTIGAFLVSVMVMDHFSMRYLAVLTLALPFASLPALSLFGPRRFAALLVPHLVASAIGGWVGYGPFVRGALPVLETPERKDDDALFHLLRSRNVTFAEADYWASYRLTFLFREDVVVVPTHPGEDRYAPYRRAFEAAPTFAYVFDPGRSREDVTTVERSLARANASVEKTRAGGLTVFLVTR